MNQGTPVLIKKLTAPSAPTATLAGAGAGLLSNGLYGYKVTFIAQGKESAASPAVTETVVDFTTDGKINLTAIPVSTDPSVTSRKIYRTTAGGGTYQLLTTIANNTATTFLDNIADASLGAAVAPTVSSVTNFILRTGRQNLHRVIVGFGAAGQIEIGDSATLSTENTRVLINGTIPTSTFEIGGEHFYGIVVSITGNVDNVTLVVSPSN